MSIDPRAVAVLYRQGFTIAQIADRYRVGIGVIDDVVRTLLRS